MCVHPREGISWIEVIQVHSSHLLEHDGATGGLDQVEESRVVVGHGMEPEDTRARTPARPLRAGRSARYAREGPNSCPPADGRDFGDLQVAPTPGGAQPFE